MRSFSSKPALFIASVLCVFTLRAQLPQTDEQVKAALKAHITFLAADGMQGRLVGSKGEKKAYLYITRQFRNTRLQPMGTAEYLQEFHFKKNLANPHGTADDSGATAITGHNVIGFLDNHAANTVVIGAHYDHLGYNEYGGSTSSNDNDKIARIHNGADDNASGTAALMELAVLLSKSQFKGNNYLFIAFSGEEEGLLGSNYFTKHPTIDLAKVTYMINMDMLGRLDTAKHSFVISGTGTSPAWEKAMQGISIDSLKVKMEASGTGSSDHTSFYYSGIPALHFFTGTHYDYHKPSDDEDKINYEGELSVVKYIYTLIGKMDKAPKLAFTKTKEDTTAKVAFKVTLGIMPDYLYEGKGVRVDGVTEGKPAQKAGIQRGDVIIQLGELQTNDMTAYMKALAAFKKGESTRAVIQRNNKEMTVDVTF